MLRYWFAIPLWQRILFALLLGVIVGLLWGEGAASIRWVGDIFVRAIRMLIVPLILVTLVAGIVGMGDIRKLGSIGVKAIGLYLLTTALAIVIGMGFGAALMPGMGVDLSGAEARVLSAPMALGDRLLSIIPTNPVAALADGNVLSIIFFAILLGVGIVLVGKPAKILADIFEASAQVVLKLTLLVMELAPFGVLALIAFVVGTQGVSVLLAAVTLAIAVYAACLTHIFLVQCGLVRVLARLPILPFMRGARDPQLLAFSTSSSAATLPATMAAGEKLGIGAPVRSSVLPLGATINMDGTAIYVGIVALFSAQVFGIDLAFADYVTIALTTTLVSIGTAAVPSASLFLLAAVLTAIGVTPEQAALVVGFVLPFDRLLDMMRTTVNVTGDLSVATLVAKSEGELAKSYK